MELQDFIGKYSNSPHIERPNYPSYLRFLKRLDSLGFYSHLPVELREEVYRGQLNSWGRVFVHCNYENRDLTPGIVRFVEQCAPFLNDDSHDLSYDLSLRAVYETISHHEKCGSVSEYFEDHKAVFQMHGIEYGSVAIRAGKDPDQYELIIDDSMVEFTFDLTFEEGWYQNFSTMSHCLHSFNI